MSEAKMEIKEATMETCKILEKLQSGILKDLSSPETMSLEEAKEITDMIKDMAETKKNLVEAIYKEKILEAMEESEYGEEYDEEGPMRAGYRGRNKRNGRYMHRESMRPIDSDPVENYRMGYREGRMDSGRSDTGMQMRAVEPSRHGISYDRYQTARRHYTESPDEGKRMNMNMEMDNAIDDALQALKKMYMDADPTNRKKVNQKLAKALQEMPA